MSLADIDARLASGYAEFKQPLMVAVADVSALRGALRADPGALREALDEERLARALHDEYCGVLGCLGFQQESTKHHDKWYQSAARLRAALTEAPQEESGLMPDDRKFLLWCHERFAAIFHESPNLDWMQRLRALAASQESGSKP